MSEVRKALGKKFSGTIIEDPVLEPYFIICYGPGDFSINKKRTDLHGKFKFSTIRYPSTFFGCLDSIAKEKLNETGDYQSIQDYIEAWKNVSETVRRAYKDWNIDSI